MPSPLILMKDGRDEPPLFITHGLGGYAGELEMLIEQFGSSRPIYCLQWRGLDGLEEPDDNFHEMARYFAHAIVSACPGRPYLLAGLSIGGLPMLEVARILLGQGKQVALLALMDAYPHSKYWPLSSKFDVTWARIKWKVRQTTELPLRESVPFAYGFMSKFVRRFLSRLRGVEIIHTEDNDVSAELKKLRLAAVAAYFQYRPRYYPGKIVFLSARVRTVFPNNPRNVWRRLTPELEVLSLPCHHVAMIREEAKLAAQALELAIRRAVEGCRRNEQPRTQAQGSYPLESSAIL